MSLEQFKLYFSNNEDVWLELSDSAPSQSQREYCIKRYMEVRKLRTLPWWKRILNFVLDIWHTV